MIHGTWYFICIWNDDAGTAFTISILLYLSMLYSFHRLAYDSIIL